jgi:hypothetical protein
MEDYVHTCRFLIITLLDGAFEYSNGGKLLGYVGTNAEPLSVEFCNFVQCHIFVNCLTWYC